MGRFRFFWTIMLILIILFGFAPVILAALGYVLITLGDCTAFPDNSVCNWGARLRFLLIFAIGTLPAMGFALAFWAVAKSVLCRPRRALQENLQELGQDKC